MTSCKLWLLPLSGFYFTVFAQILLLRCRRPEGYTCIQGLPTKTTSDIAHFSHDKQLTQSSQDPLGLDCLIGSSLFKIV